MSETIRIEGERTVLRAFRPREEMRWWESRQGLDPVVGQPPSRERVHRIVSRSGRLWRGRLDLAIEANRRLIGDIQARTGWSKGMPASVFEIGIAIWDPRDRRHGYGSEAVGLLTRRLLDEGAARVQLSTSVDNTAMRRAAEKTGYRFEGVLRAFWPSADGDHEDYAMYAVTSGDRLLPP